MVGEGPGQLDSDRGWVGVLSTDVRRHVGDVTTVLLRNAAGWVHRRVETITFHDERVVTRHLSVDFTLPTWLESELWEADGKPVVFVPVTLLLRGEKRMNLDVRDEGGVALPLVTEGESELLTGATLAEIARRVLHATGVKEPVDPQILAAIAHVVTAKGFRQALPYVRSLISPANRAWDYAKPQAREQREILVNDAEFCDFLGAFAASSIAFVPLACAGGVRRIVKITYDDDVSGTPPGLGWPQRALTRIGWSPTFALPRMPLIGLAESSHVQVMPPENVDLTEAGMRARRPSDIVRAAAGLPVSGDETYRMFLRGPIRRAHIYSAPTHQMASGVTWVAVRAERRGLLFGAVIAALLIASVLAFFVFHSSAAAQQSSSTSSLLLLAPALVAAYLVRPGEHAMARKLLAFPRLFLIVAAGMTFAAAALLIAFNPVPPSGSTMSDPVPDELLWWLRGVAAGAAVALVLLLLSFVFPRPRKHERAVVPGDSASS